VLEIALTGKPNSGKSSFFKAATMIDVKISPIPFTTLKPCTAISYVTSPCVCKEFNVKCQPKNGACINGIRFIPVKLWDLPGIIQDAHKGRGLGLQFLDSIRQASVLIQIVDCSGLTDSEGKPTTGYDPNNEIKFLEEEIDLWFTEIIKRALQKIDKAKSREELVNILTQQLSGLEIKKEHVEETLQKVPVTRVEEFAKIIRKIAKPILIAANKIDLKPAQENFERLKKIYKNIVPTSAEAEIALKKAAEKNLIDYLPGNGFTIKGEIEEKQFKALEFIKREIIEKYGSTGVQVALNKAVFELLNYIVVYPVEDENRLTDKDGNVLPDAFLMPPNSTALDLAFKIHTELGEKFICAIDARTKKKLGKNYVLKNNDVIKIVFAH
jgi:ribosome-binding ATPase YchF (GTP1/OBG family)